jgi:hypothetical protein
MRHRRMKELILVGLALTAVVGMGLAQETVGGMRGPVTIVIDTPFPFMVDNTQLPAGKYEIYRADQWDFVISTPKGDIKANFATDPTDKIQPPVKGSAVFDVIGNNYYLAKFFYAGQAYGYYLPKSRVEKAAMKTGMPTTKEVPAEVKK